MPEHEVTVGDVLQKQLDRIERQQEVIDGKLDHIVESQANQATRLLTLETANEQRRESVGKCYDLIREMQRELDNIKHAPDEKSAKRWDSIIGETIKWLVIAFLGYIFSGRLLPVGK